MSLLPADERKQSEHSKCFARSVVDVLAENPALLNAKYEEWNETGLGAASHVGNRQIAEYMTGVFTDQVAHVSRYGSLIQGIGIDQAPAIVIVDHDRRARLIQGYVDAETLAQEVSDTRG